MNKLIDFFLKAKDITITIFKAMGFEKVLNNLGNNIKQCLMAGNFEGIKAAFISAGVAIFAGINLHMILMALLGYFSVLIVIRIVEWLVDYLVDLSTSNQ